MDICDPGYLQLFRQVLKKEIFLLLSFLLSLFWGPPPLPFPLKSKE